MTRLVVDNALGGEVKLVGKAFKVEDLPKEIQDMIGGYGKALIMPIDEEKRVTSSGKSLRDLLIENNELNDNAVPVVPLLDKAYKLMEVAYNEIESGRRVNIEIFDWINQFTELIEQDIQDQEDSKSGDIISYSFSNYIGEDMAKLLKFYYDNISGCRNGAGTVNSTMFEYMVYKNNEEYSLCDCSRADGVTNYINVSLLADKYIAQEPLDNFFALTALENGEKRHSYYASKSFAKYRMDNVDGDVIARDVINRMYDCNMNLYLNVEMSLYNMIEYDKGNIRVFDSYEEWFGGSELNLSWLE